LHLYNFHFVYIAIFDITKYSVLIMIYSKEAFTIEKHLTQLIERGLIISNIEEAKHYLTNISYYRLAGYWWPMQSDKIDHKFKQGSTFNDVISLYSFDSELRVLLFDVIEKIEISLRTKLIYHLSHEFDAWWFQNTTIFQNTTALIKTLSSIQEEVERSKDIFIKEHNKKYRDDLRFPPAWKTLELTSFGSLSKLYGNLKNSVKSKDIIAQELGAVNHSYLPSWLEAIAQIRNYCAHHSRLWNKNLPGGPKILSKPPFRWVNDVPTDTQRIYLHLCIMRYLLNIILPENTFATQLKALIKKYPSVDPNALGLKPNWDKELLWN
jgi:abortive infection bacteriophage resistance protein